MLKGIGDVPEKSLTVDWGQAPLCLFLHVLCHLSHHMHGMAYSGHTAHDLLLPTACRW